MDYIALEDYVETDGQVFWGRAGAGILCVALDTKRVLLLLRSQEVEQPGTWGVAGGSIEGDPKRGALQELREETGYRGAVDLVDGFVFSKGSFKFYNYIGFVPKEFRPKLDWENSKYGWFDLSDLPSPLHFGVKALLPSARKVIRNRRIANLHLIRGLRSRIPTS